MYNLYCCRAKNGSYELFMDGRHIYASELMKQKKYRPDQGPLLLNEIPSV